MEKETTGDANLKISAAVAELEGLSDSSDIERIGALAVRAAELQVVDLPTERVFVGVDGTDAPVKVAKPPAPRQHAAESLDALINLVDDESCIWHSGDKVVAVLDDKEDSHRLDTVTWALTPTEAWETVTGNVMRDVDQKSLLRTLETKLRREVKRDAPALVDSLRTVKFNANKQAEGTISHGNESIGRSIKAEATGATQIPEWVTLTVKRWAELDFTIAIELRVDVDVHRERFTVAATKDDVRAAELACQAMLNERVSGQVGCPVIAGRP